MKVTMDFKGGRELEAALRDLAEQTGKSRAGKAVMRRAAVEAITPMRDLARQLAPDDPATPPPFDLKTSIQVSGRQRSRRHREKKNEVKVFMGPTKEGYPQAVPQEMGTVHHPAQPYMRPAFDHEAGRTIERLGDAAWNQIEKAAARHARRAAKNK